jgi:hypothetical protein
MGSRGQLPGISRFYWVLWGFSGNRQFQSCSMHLSIVDDLMIDHTYCMPGANRVPVTHVGVTKVLETVRKYLDGRARH